MHFLPSRLEQERFTKMYQQSVRAEMQGSSVPLGRNYFPFLGPPTPIVGPSESPLHVCMCVCVQSSII